MQQSSYRPAPSSAKTAIEQWYQLHAASLLAYVRQHVPSQEDAEDIVVETFIAALEQKEDSLSGGTEQEQLAWLRRVAYHKCIDQHRRSVRRPTVPVEIASETLFADERLTLFAALLCTFLLVGSLLVVFQAARSGHGSPRLGTKPTDTQAIYLSKTTGIEKIDPQTHKSIWSTAFPAQPKGSPADAGTSLVIGDTLYTVRSSQLFALNTSDGHIRWSQPGLSLPFADNGVLYIDPPFAELPPNITPTPINAQHSSFVPTIKLTLDSKLFTLNPVDGTTRVAYQGPANGWDVLTVANGILYYGYGTYGANSGIFAIRLADQQQLWHHQLTKDQYLANIEVQNGILYAQIMDMSTPGSDGRIIAFDASKGNQLWSTPALPTSVRTTAITNTAIYVASIGELNAYDAHSGKALWQKPLDTVNILTDANTLYINYVAAHQEGATALAALNAADGTVIWQKNMSWLEANSPLGIQNGVLYTAYDNGSHGELDALNASDGSSLWHMPISGDATIWQACFG